MPLNIPEIEFFEFSKHFSASDQRIPQEGTFELTYRCNLNCAHCYCNGPELKKKQEELTFKEICRIMDDAAQEGCLWLAFTGGEPLVRDDFFDLYLYAKKKGFLIALLTNASLINEKAADFFKEWPPKQVEISLYGTTEEIYEKVTRVKGSFKQCIRAINLLVERKIPLEIKTVALTTNKHEIKKISEFARKIGVRFRYDPLIHCKFNGDTSPHALRLNAAECLDLEQELEGFQSYWQRLCSSYAGVEIDIDSLYTCGAGKNMFMVNPYGNLQTCVYAGKYNYDIRKGSFKDGWYNFIPQIINRKRIKRDYECKHCRIRYLCNQCPHWAYLENKDEEKVVDYICELSLARLERFGIANTQP
jgi:radical SAM protein with 4Fe4S-binding SPASM domain